MSEVTEGKTETPAIAEPAARHIQELNPTRMKECEFERTVYTATAHEETLPEDLLVPSYWTHCAETFKPFDKVEVRADDGSWYVELLVLETSRRWARMFLLAKHNLTTADVSLTQAKLQEFAVEYKGPHKLHCIIRLSDNEMIHEGERTKAGAHEWLAGRIKAGI